MGTKRPHDLLILSDMYFKVKKPHEKYGINHNTFTKWKKSVQHIFDVLTPELAEACLRPSVRVVSADVTRLKQETHQLRWELQTRGIDPDVPRVIRLAERLRSETVQFHIPASALPPYLENCGEKNGVRYVAVIVDEVPEDQITLDTDFSVATLDAQFDVPVPEMEHIEALRLQLLDSVLIELWNAFKTKGTLEIVPMTTQVFRCDISPEEFKKFETLSDEKQLVYLEKLSRAKETERMGFRQKLKEGMMSDMDLQRLERYMEIYTPTEVSAPDAVMDVSESFFVVARTDRWTWTKASGKKRRTYRKPKPITGECQTVQLTDAGFYYIPRGNIKKSWECYDREQLLLGGRNTGKTISNVYRGHLAAVIFPGTRIIVLRQKLGTVHESFGKTFEGKAANLDSAAGRMQNAMVRRTGVQDEDGFVYWNGSTIDYAGTWNRGDVLSMEYDLAISLQTEQILEADWQHVNTSLGRGIARHTPYHFILGDCNPPEAGSYHWVFHRPEITRIETIHRDNPEIWDAEKKQATEFGQPYLKVLESLPGSLRKRFFEGKVDDSELRVYPDFKPGTHVISQADFENRLETVSAERVYLGFDAGYRPNPGVLMITMVGSDDALYVIQGIARVAAFDEFWVERAVEYDQWSREVLGRRVHKLYSEHVPQIQDRFRMAGLPVQGAEKRDKMVSIRQVQALLAAENQFFIVREHADMDPCPVLSRRNVPQTLIDEFLNYQFTEAYQRKGGDPVPQDVHDHWLDTLLYIVRTAKIGAAQQRAQTESQTFTADDLWKKMQKTREQERRSEGMAGGFWGL